MNSLYYTRLDLLGHEYEVEIEYQYEPEEDATPTSPPYPAQVLILLVNLMRNQDGRWTSVDIEGLLDASQERLLQAEILEHIRRLDLPRRVTKRRSYILTDEREAA